MENYNPLAKVCGQMGKKITTLIKKDKGFFVHILIGGRPQFTKIGIYEPGKIAIYEN